MNNKCNTCAKQFTCNRKECKKVTFVQVGIIEKPKIKSKKTDLICKTREKVSKNSVLNFKK